MSNSLREQLKEHYNASQQVAIATVMSPGQALFSLLQVSAKALPLPLPLPLQHAVYNAHPDTLAQTF